MNAEMKVCEKTLFKSICIHKMFTEISSTITASQSGMRTAETTVGSVLFQVHSIRSMNANTLERQRRFRNKA